MGKRKRTSKVDKWIKMIILIFGAMMYTGKWLTNKLMIYQCLLGIVY
ncbi:hypothetical protein ACFQ4Z_00080 [Oceanobacillus oncorhynchi subsp. oncorhynchi]